MNPSKILTHYAESVSDKEILGEYLQAQDVDKPYLRNKNTYAWYYAIAREVQPKVLAEIGSRFGYSLRAMLCGFTPDFVYVWDNESYDPGCLVHVTKMLETSEVKHCISRADTQLLPSLEATSVDLFHVDGDHSIQGAYLDLEKAYKCLSPNGVIVIDDTTSCPGVHAAVKLFNLDYPVECIEVPSFNGLSILLKKS